MARDFEPPKNDAEFNKRAAEISVEGARNVIRALESRKAAMVEPIEEEIRFYKRVLRSKGETL